MKRRTIFIALIVMLLTLAAAQVYAEDFGWIKTTTTVVVPGSGIGGPPPNDQGCYPPDGSPCHPAG